jgi:DNA end-binding protein Ku
MASTSCSKTRSSRRSRSKARGPSISTALFDIDCFVAAGSIGWIWYDTPHYLIPEDKIGEEAFSVIREAMVRSATRAISRVVLNHRERAVLLEPRDRGIVLWTFRYGKRFSDDPCCRGDNPRRHPKRVAGD